MWPQVPEEDVIAVLWAAKSAGGAEEREPVALQS